MSTRTLRILLVANDGASAGHVMRVLAVARGLSRQAEQRGFTPALLLATTSEAHQLGSEQVAVVRLPAPVAGRRAGLTDVERRRITGAALESVADAFGPDLLVVDTFPSGPHGELAGLLSTGRMPSRAKRAIVRRSLPLEVADHPTVARGLDRYDLAIVADDPYRDETLRLPLRTVHVPPITLTEPADAESRDLARARFEVPRGMRAVLVAAGGGADQEAEQYAARIVKLVKKAGTDVFPISVTGPLASGPGGVRVAPMAPWLAAFDGAFSAAGYNTSHELVKAGIPSALFAMPRPFDDQAARVQRFARASLAFPLERFDEESLREAMAWIDGAPRVGLPSGGADEAARALLELVGAT
ncbi:hypothetical protein LVJ94_08495 [Pendulispora rubella]|uniref:UDP-N-acetylglucosamine--N-acetylmuramyl-(Pentapeptide) pyrophosphoryl-undecaprenol N-acetylglucosamine transferase n=1 Tax=Pendulispora rubella TaxID=2741070 RepID=A0ABZ2LCI5_9BACT